LHGGFDAGALGYVAAHEVGVTATVARAFACGPSCRLAGRLVNIGNDDLGPLLSKSLGRSPADATAAAGYESNLAEEPSHRCPLA
jgi:hypothetical protein